MIESGDYEREDGDFGDSVRRPDSPSYDALIDRNSNSHSNSKKNEIRGIAGNGQLSCEISSGNELNRLSRELDQRITQEIDALMSSVNSPIQWL